MAQLRCWYIFVLYQQRRFLGVREISFPLSRSFWEFSTSPQVSPVSLKWEISCPLSSYQKEREIKGTRLIAIALATAPSLNPDMFA